VTATVRIPTQLRPLCGGAGEVVVEGRTVREVLHALDTEHPGIGARVLDERGSLRRFVNLFVAEEDVRFLDGLDTPVEPGQTVSILPAVAGG
jgi:molybdopterin synthase sulfur carrier subunit